MSYLAILYIGTGLGIHFNGDGTFPDTNSGHDREALLLAGRSSRLKELTTFCMISRATVTQWISAPLKERYTAPKPASPSKCCPVLGSCDANTFPLCRPQGRDSTLMVVYFFSFYCHSHCQQREAAVVWSHATPWLETAE